MNNENNLLNLFPNQSVTFIENGHDGDVINGLAADSIPAGKILVSGMDPRKKDRVTHFVQYNNELLYLNVCNGMHDAGDECFAVIHVKEKIETPEAAMLLKYSKELGMIEIPANIPPTINNAVQYVQSQEKAPTANNLLNLFPNQNVTLGRGGDEINGLAADSIPAGKILFSGMGPREKDRVFHFVECNNELFYLRVCAAMPGEDYACFVVVHDRGVVGSPEEANILSRLEDMKQRYFIEIPSNIPPTISNSARYVKASKDATLEPSPPYP